MKVAIVSDGHGNLPDIPDCDLFLYGGDICPVWNHDVSYQAYWLQHAFLSWLEAIPAKQKYFCFGNHDLIGTKAFHLVPKELHQYYLEDAYAEFEGWKIWGTPWQPPFGFGWSYNLTEEQLASKYKWIPDDTEILLSHCPPFGYGDKVPIRINNQNEESWPESEHVGSHALLERIQTLPNLKLLACGHVHEGFGNYQFGNVLIVNASLLDAAYKPVNPVQIVELIK